MTTPDPEVDEPVSSLPASLDARSQPATLRVRIGPRTKLASLGLWDVWTHRELLAFLAVRDIRLRYKQTFLGVGWAVLQPTLTMLVFTLVFGRIARLGSETVPYPLLAFCGLLPWQLFAFTLAQSSSSVVNEQRLVTKVFFPRLILPFASVGPGLLDFTVSFVAFFVLLLLYGRMPPLSSLLIPFFGALAVLHALALGIWLATLTVKYRDFRYTIPFLVQLWLFASPVAYISSAVPQQWRRVFGLNPMVSVIDGFRWALLGTPSPSLSDFLAPIAVSSLLLFGGILYFRRAEIAFADIV